MENLAKINAKNIGIVPKAKSIAKGASVPLAVIYGIATAYKIVQSNGEFVKFIGNFEAVNMASGKGFKSTSLILPRVVEEVLQSGIDAAGDAGKTGVGFAVILGVRHSDKAHIGYDWMSQAIESPQVNDALAGLRAKTAAAVSTMTPPAPVTTTETEKSSSKKKH